MNSSLANCDDGWPDVTVRRPSGFGERRAEGVNVQVDVLPSGTTVVAEARRSSWGTVIGLDGPALCPSRLYPALRLGLNARLRRDCEPSPKSVVMPRIICCRLGREMI